MHTFDSKAQARQALSKALQQLGSCAVCMAQSHLALQEQVSEVLKAWVDKKVGLYWPLGDEFDWQNTLELATYLLPKPEGEGMVFAPVVKDDILQPYQSWGGVHVPQKPAEVPDMILVPGLGFSPSKYRLGRGFGTYDAYLSQHPQVHKVGITLFPEMIQFPCDEHDIPMNEVLGPLGEDLCKDCQKIISLQEIG